MAATIQSASISTAQDKHVGVPDDCQSHQLLIRFQDKTHVVSFHVDNAAPTTKTATCYSTYSDSVENQNDDGTCSDTNRLIAVLLERLAHVTGWPTFRLHVTHFNHPFVQVVIRSSIRGGKGGFGTLLKGQSRQAGAKLTTDFGACRDLQGRRLRHVNDEIKLRKFRERQRREASGLKVDGDDLWKTPSGIYNWHLMTPTWADISKKAAYRIRRQFQQLDREEQRKALLKKEQDDVYQKTMIHYLNETTSVSESVQQELTDALKQGLLSKQKKRKRSTTPGAVVPAPASTSETIDDEEGGFTFSDNDQPSSLVSLSGEVVVESRDNSSVQLQSKSEFMTAVLVLDHALSTSGETTTTTTTTPSVLYYEVTLVTGGLAQIGWASLVGNEDNATTTNGTSQGFLPNNDLGDGVGDDASSFAVDGSRGLKFHGGNEWAYPIRWKEGDRLGCIWNCKNGTISYTLNGQDLGSNTFSTNLKSLVPAFSCNQGEILELHTTKADCRHFPDGEETAIAVMDMLESAPVQQQLPESIGAKEPEKGGTVESSSKEISSESGLQRKEPTDREHETKLVGEHTEKDEPIDLDNPLDLDKYHSAQELEKLGLDRLKSALMALQVKCG